MSKESPTRSADLAWLPALLLALPLAGFAQVPVDDDGNPLGQFDATNSTAAETADQIPLLSAAELEDLVGPIALYPDDLLAIVLPASTYPLQLVQAERFLRDLEKDPSLKPDESWDDSVVALVNYPEAVELLTRDLDKTWRLGEAVVAQQADVIAAVESFRDRAYAAGNLQSDTHQTVARSDGVIQITPVEDDIIYVPYYQPERVVVYQPRPVYHYYPRPYPVYYYPYPAGYAFHHGYFWGVTTAFTVGWYTDRLHVYHHSYHGHPYYGHSYWNRYWYRRPDIHIHNRYYSNHHHSHNRHRYGDYWRPQSRRTVSRHDHRVTRSRHYPGQATASITQRRDALGLPNERNGARTTTSRRQEITFRDRRASPAKPQPGSIKPNQSRSEPTRRSVSRPADSKRAPQQKIEFRERETPKHLATVRPNAQRAGQTRKRQPQLSQPRVSQPRVSQPKVSQPRVSQPRVSQPKVGQSRISQPRVSQPRVSQRRVSQPRVSQPRVSQPKVSQSRQGKPQRSEARKSGSDKVASSARSRSKSAPRDRR